MHDAMNLVVLTGNLIAEQVNLFLLFDIADIDGGITEQLTERIATFFRSNGIDHIGSGFAQQLTCMIGDAFAIRRTENENGFSGKLKKIHH